MSFKNFDAVVTVTDTGINQTIKQFLRWRNPGLFPYRVYHRFDLIDPALDLKLEIPLPTIAFDGSSDMNGIKLSATAIGYANEDTVALTILTSFDFVLKGDEVGLKLRDIEVKIDINNEVTSASLADALNGHLQTLQYLLKDVPLYGEYLNFIPVFSNKTIAIGPEPSLAINIQDFTLLNDSEGIFMGSNEIQVRGKVQRLIQGKGEAELVGEFGLPYETGVQEGDTRNINQRLVFKRPEIGDHIVISCQLIEMDTWSNDHLQQVDARYKVEYDQEFGIRLRRIGDLLSYLPTAPLDTLANSRDLPGVVKYDNYFNIFPIIPDEMEDPSYDYKIGLSIENLVGRLGHLAIPSEGLDIDSGKMVVQGVLKDIGTLSFGITLWNEIELEYKWNHVWVDASLLDPEGLAKGFLVEAELAGRKLTFELPSNTENWVPLPNSSNYKFRVVPDERLVNGESHDVRNYHIKVYRYLDDEKTNLDFLAEKSWIQEDTTDPTAFSVIPDLGVTVIEEEGFGVEYLTELISAKDVGGSDIPIQSTDPESHVSVSLSQRFINKLIDLRTINLPSHFVFSKNESAFDIFIVVNRIGKPELKLERLSNPLNILFGTATDDTLTIRQRVSIEGYVNGKILGLFTGDFDSGEYPLEIKGSPYLHEDGYTTHLQLKGMETNLESLVAAILMDYGSSLGFLDRVLYNLILAPGVVGLYLSQLINIDGILLSNFLNEELKNLDYSPDSFSIPSSGTPALKRLYWAKDNQMERIGLDGSHRKMIPEAPNSSFPILTPNHYNNLLYWVESDEIKWMDPEGIPQGSFPLSGVSAIGFDSNSTPETANVIYYAQGAEIYRADSSGSGNPEQIVSTSAIPNSLIIDSESSYIFWSTSDTIFSSSLSLPNEVSVATGLAPGIGMTYDRNTSRIIWFNGQNIQAMDPDGANNTTIISNANVSQFGLFFDSETNKIFWHDPVEKVLKWASIDGSAQDKLTDVGDNISALTLLLHPGVLGWVSYARGFSMAVRPRRLAITNVAISFGCNLDVNIGGENFGVYGPTHMTVGIDKTTSPLSFEDGERRHMRDKLLGWMEYANLAFDIVPYSQNPWIKIKWEQNPAIPASVGSVEGLMDDGAIVRLNPSYQWRTHVDIGAPNPEYRLSYDYWIARLLGHALGIYNPISAIEDSEDEMGPVMAELQDAFRDDYILRVEDVQAIQGLFGKRPIPFQPVVQDDAALENSMRNSLQAISSHVTYRKAVKDDNADQLANGHVEFALYVESISIARHEDDGGWFSNDLGEYDMRFSAKLGNRGTHEWNKGYIEIPLNQRNVGFNHRLNATSEKFTYAEVESGNIHLHMYSRINAVDDLDADHAKEASQSIALNRIGNGWNDFINSFKNQPSNSNPPAMSTGLRSGIWVREPHEPFDIFVVFRVEATIPGYLSKVQIEEGQRQAAEISLKQALPNQATNFLEQVKNSLISYAETNIQQLKDEVDQYVQNLLNDIITEVDQELDITDQQSLASQASNLAWDLYRQVYPTPEAREREIFDQIVQEELLDVAEELLSEVQNMLPESFTDYLLDNVLNQNSPTALGFLKERWGSIEPYLFNGISHADARRIITPRLETLREQVKSRAQSQTTWLTSSAKKLSKLPPALVVEANQHGGISSEHIEVKRYTSKIQTAFKEVGQVIINIPEFIPLGRTPISVAIPGIPKPIATDVVVQDTIAPALTIPATEIHFSPTTSTGIRRDFDRLRRFLNGISSFDQADKLARPHYTVPEVIPIGKSEFLVSSKDQSGNESFGAFAIVVSPTRYALYGKEQVILGQEAVVNSGFIGTDSTDSKPDRRRKKTRKKLVKLGTSACLMKDTMVFTEKITLANNSHTDIIFCEEIQGQDCSTNQVAPLPERPVNPVPPSPKHRYGRKKIAIVSGDKKRKNQLFSNAIIEPGAYFELTVQSGTEANPTIVTLSSGRYDFHKIQLGHHVRLLFDGPCDLILSGSFITGNHCYVGGKEDSDMNASHLVFHLVKDQKTRGAQNFKIGKESELFASVFGDSCQIKVGAHSIIKGALIGKQVNLEDGVHVTYEKEIGMRFESLMFLNRVENASEIMNMVFDDAAFGKPSPRAYGIRKKLAQRLIDSRDALPDGKYTLMREVDDVFGMGTDTLHDLVYTFRDGS